MNTEKNSSESTNLSRRRFLLNLGAAGLGASVGVISGANIAFGATASSDDLLLNVFSKHLQFLDYDRMAEVAARIGFDGVDLTVRPGGHVLPERVGQDLPRAVAAVRAQGLKAEMMTTAITGAGEEFSEQVLQVAAEQGIRLYRTGWLRHPDDRLIPESLESMKKRMRDLADLNRRIGIKGAYQNHAGNYVGASIWELWTLIKDVDTEWLGCQYDIRHATVEGGLSWPQGIRLIQPYINSLVLKDFRWEEQEGVWQPVNTPLGEGMVDLPQYFSLLKEYRMHGPVSIHFEYALGGAEHGATDIEIPLDQVVEAMQRDVQTVRRIWRDTK